ncbi:MAG TPA: feruloyl-CoA synthase [Myxococcales bacterium]|nr:feruloyl-CoA synthase [Myxococcales bacterium]
MSRSRFAPAEVDVSYRSDGAMVLRSPRPLGDVPRSLVEVLARWAERAPDRPFLAERADRSRPGAPGWRTVSYAEAWAAARSLGQALLQRGLGPERPLLILSEGSVDHALLALGAMSAGVPVAPVSAAYSLQSKDFAKLRAIASQLTPGLTFAETGAYARALEALPSRGPVVMSRDLLPGAEPLSALLQTPAPPGPPASTGPDTVAKVLFTSGSTGQPKGVINTQRMLCSNQEMLAAGWPFLRERPPVLCDWLPWSHTFGANHNFNLVLWHGGTLYIDDGKPAPALIDRTVQAFGDVSPTLYVNVPRGFDAFAPFLEQDAALRERFFSRLEVVFYAAAALSQPAWDRWMALVRKSGRDVSFVSAWGSTETSPLATQVHEEIDRPGPIGLPPPGAEVKLVPHAGKLEMRVRGPHVTPGYWRAPELTAAAFDGEGFYRIGDAGRFVDPADPRRGLAFDGRLAEDFKLSSGSWVRVGALRLAVVSAAAPLVQDAAICGHDRDGVGALLFLDARACAALAGAPASAPPPLPELARHPELRRAITLKLAAHNARAGGDTLCVRRALLLDEPPSIDAGEITDKGYLNQRAVLERRAAQVARLYAGRGGDGAGSGDPDLLEIGQGGPPVQ